MRKGEKQAQRSEGGKEGKGKRRGREGSEGQRRTEQASLGETDSGGPGWSLGVGRGHPGGPGGAGPRTPRSRTGPAPGTLATPGPEDPAPGLWCRERPHQQQAAAALTMEAEQELLPLPRAVHLHDGHGETMGRGGKHSRRQGMVVLIQEFCKGRQEAEPQDPEGA